MEPEEFPIDRDGGADAEMRDQPIFVVGVQRSGTTLLAAMLAAHSRLSCGPETHFFRWLSRVDAARLCARETWPREAAEFVMSIDHVSVQRGSRPTLLGKYQIEENSIPAYLQDREPSISTILCSVTEQHMRANGKARWVEKTPDHLLHVQAIREYFPEAPVIRIVRDPRDVALSLMKVPWGVGSFLEGLLYWERLDRQSREFFATDSLCHTLHFEDLVLSPSEELRKVCRFIHEDFEEGMLDTSRTGAQINSRSAPWKDKVSQAVDASRAAAWRSELTKRENQLAESILGDRIEALGYSREEEFGRVGEICQGRPLAVKYAGALAILASSGVRFWKKRPDERVRAKVYLGEPGTEEWLGGQKAVMSILPVLADVAKARMSGSDLYWIPDGNNRKWTGYASLVLRKFLAPYRLEPAS